MDRRYIKLCRIAMMLMSRQMFCFTQNRTHTHECIMRPCLLALSGIPGFHHHLTTVNLINWSTSIMQNFLERHNNTPCWSAHLLPLAGALPPLIIQEFKKYLLGFKISRFIGLQGKKEIFGSLECLVLEVLGAWYRAEIFGSAVGRNK